MLRPRRATRMEEVPGHRHPPLPRQRVVSERRETRTPPPAPSLASCLTRTPPPPSLPLCQTGTLPSPLSPTAAALQAPASSPYTAASSPGRCGRRSSTASSPDTGRSSPSPATVRLQGRRPRASSGTPPCAASRQGSPAGREAMDAGASAASEGRQGRAHSQGCSVRLLHAGDQDATAATPASTQPSAAPSPTPALAGSTRPASAPSRRRPTIPLRHPWTWQRSKARPSRRRGPPSFPVPSMRPLRSRPAQHLCSVPGGLLCRPRREQGLARRRTLSCTTTATSARGCGGDDADLDTVLWRRRRRPRHGVVAAATSTRPGCGCGDDDGDLDTGLQRR